MAPTHQYSNPWLLKNKLVVVSVARRSPCLSDIPRLVTYKPCDNFCLKLKPIKVTRPVQNRKALAYKETKTIVLAVSGLVTKTIVASEKPASNVPAAIRSLWLVVFSSIGYWYCSTIVFIKSGFHRFIFNRLSFFSGFFCQVQYKS